MDDSRIAAQGPVFLGCSGRGSALLAGWLARGLPTTPAALSPRITAIVANDAAGVRLLNETDDVTGFSGSGPAYLLQMIEALDAEAKKGPSQLCDNVTSPNGTIQAALEMLMIPEPGFCPLPERAVGAAVHKSWELSNG